MATNFEQGFAEVERAADSAGRATDALLKATRQLRKAALEGDLTLLRRSSERLDSLLAAVKLEIGNARDAWPFSAESEEAYLRDEYRAELLTTADSAQLRISEQDGRLLAFPSVIRIQPADRSVRVDKKRLSALRPSRLVALLKVAQTKKPSLRSERFLVVLARAYDLVLKDKKRGSTVKLESVYDALTILPGVKNDYTRSDFARDLFLLDQSGLRETGTGSSFGLAAATGTRGPSHIALIDPDGAHRVYYGIWFD